MKRELTYVGVMVAMGSVLTGCNDGDRPANGNTATYTLSGTVSGLSGTGLVLGNSGVSLGIASGGSFAFTQPLSAGAAYNVTVVTQPSSPAATQPTAPAQVCTVANGAGTANANVSNVAVTCVGHRQ